MLSINVSCSKTWWLLGEQCEISNFNVFLLHIYYKDLTFWGHSFTVLYSLHSSSPFFKFSFPERIHWLSYNTGQKQETVCEIFVQHWQLICQPPSSINRYCHSGITECLHFTKCCSIQSPHSQPDRKSGSICCRSLTAGWYSQQQHQQTQHSAIQWAWCANWSDVNDVFFNVLNVFNVFFLNVFTFVNVFLHAWTGKDTRVMGKCLKKSGGNSSPSKHKIQWAQCANWSDVIDVFLHAWTGEITRVMGNCFQKSGRRRLVVIQSRWLVEPDVSWSLGDEIRVLAWSWESKYFPFQPDKSGPVCLVQHQWKCLDCEDVVLKKSQIDAWHCTWDSSHCFALVSRLRLSLDICLKTQVVAWH